MHNTTLRILFLVVFSAAIHADTLKMENTKQGENTPNNHIWAKTKSKSGEDICQPRENACKGTSSCVSCVVKYLSAAERTRFKLTFDGKIWRGADGKPYDTLAENKKHNVKSLTKYDREGVEHWGAVPGIWVLDTQGNFYTSVEHAPGRFHHSSFMAGGLVEAAGQVMFVQGKMTHINNASGHYKPSQKSLDQARKDLHLDKDTKVEYAKGSDWFGGASVVRNSKAEQSNKKAEQETISDGGYLTVD
jgi:hypothetical protein